jgi:hypothetical protein
MAGSRAKEGIWAQEKRTPGIWGFPQDYYLQKAYWAHNPWE